MSTAATDTSWEEANQRHLSACLAALESRIAALADGEAVLGDDVATEPPAARELEHPAAIDHVSDAFALTAFERDALLLAAGIELSGAFADLVARVQGGERVPTVSLALAALAAPHWSAFAPASPLRRWRLVRLDLREGLARAGMQIDERALHYLTGVSYLDDELAGILEPLGTPDALLPTHEATAAEIADLWSLGADAPIVQLVHAAGPLARRVTASAAERIGAHAHALDAHAIPARGDEREEIVRRWQREVVLDGCALLIETDADTAMRPELRVFLARLAGPIAVIGRDPVNAAGRPLARVDLRRPPVHEIAAAWELALGPDLARATASVVDHFALDQAAIDAIALQAGAGPAAACAQRVWTLARRHTRPNLAGLAYRVEPRARYADLVIPDAQRTLLEAIAAHVRARTTVAERWGFGAVHDSGLGVSALFAGPSGTGKSLAADVLAAELGVDLYRVDLAAIVSKYIGETEKNLGAIFDAAETGGGVLCFEEADALFARRSEVRDSHDRYANLEVAYLLARMERFRGLAVLTTNLADTIDPAFLRRIRFVVRFPFPDAAERERIWRAVVPADAPVDDLDYRALARLSLTGASIRSIALGAASLAAEQGSAIGQAHVLDAVRLESAKLERPLAIGTKAAA